MSIVVTCSCTRTYRLPDRYAGKRCRCRDCGEKIAVPAHEVAASDVKPRRKRRAKDDPSRTTRRLSSQDNEILGERRRLRSSQRTGPLSESMHQIAPMTLSGDLPIAPPRPKQKKTPAPSSASTTKKKKKKAAEAAAKAETISEAPARRTAKKGRVEPAREAKAKKKDRKGARGAKADERGARKGRKRSSREDDRLAPARGKARKGYSLHLVLGIAGALVLGIGLVIGGLTSGGGATAAVVDADLERRLAHIEGLQQNRAWADAEAECGKLEAELRAAGDEAGAARVKAIGSAVAGMATIAAMEDDEQKLGTLLQNANNRSVALRFGVVMELRELAELDEAQAALAVLARDADRRIAEAARHGLVQAGGPHSIPYLGQTIEQCAASGHKLGDVALERALELSEPAVVPVLLTALRVRASAPAPTLKAILGKLADLGDASAKDAVKPFLTHADEGVREAAQACVDALD